LGAGNQDIPVAGRRQDLGLVETGGNLREVERLVAVLIGGMTQFSRQPDAGLRRAIGMAEPHQNLHLAGRQAAPLLEECLSRGVAFVPFCPLGWPRGRDNPVLPSPVGLQTAARLGVTPAQVALQWLLQLAPNVLLIPGTGSIAHLRENLAAEGVRLDDEALRTLDGVGV